MYIRRTGDWIFYYIYRLHQFLWKLDDEDVGGVQPHKRTSHILSRVIITMFDTGISPSGWKCSDSPQTRYCTKASMVVRVPLLHPLLRWVNVLHVYTRVAFCTRAHLPPLTHHINIYL